MDSSGGSNGSKKGKSKLSKVTAAPPLKQDTIFNISKVPSKPEGPLELEGTILKWQEPNSDGGAKIEHYTIEQQLPNSEEFQSLKESTVKDTKVDLKNNMSEDTFGEITFRIKAVNLKGESEPLIESVTIKKTGFSNLNVSAAEFVPFSPSSSFNAGNTSQIDNLSNNIDGLSLSNASNVEVLCDPSAVNMNGSYTPLDPNAMGFIRYQKEIDAMLEECVRNLNYEPRQFERFIENQSQLFEQWIECTASSYYAAQKVIELSSMSSDEWHNFRYFGAKICSTIIHLSVTPDFMLSIVQICSDFVDSIQYNDANPCIKGFMLFLAELYKLLENTEYNSQIGTLIIKALQILVSLPYDANNSKITIVITILKCCGYILYPNHTTEIEALFLPLLKLKENCNYKDQKMIESLENCKKSWEEEVISSQNNTDDQGDPNNLVTYDEVFYGPDGTATYVTFEESDFFEDTFRELDHGMNEDMEAAYEKFLAQIPDQ